MIEFIVGVATASVLTGVVIYWALETVQVKTADKVIITLCTVASVLTILALAAQWGLMP